MPKPTNTASGTVDGVKDTAKTAAADVATDLKSRAQDVVDNVTSEATDYADQARETVAEEVRNVASALRTAADEMRSGSAPERTFSQIADGLADASEAMRDKDLGQIVGTLNDFAKRNPLIFLGGAALVGFAATRFAKASSDGGSPSFSSGPSSSSGIANDSNRAMPGAAGSNMARSGSQTSPAGRWTEGGQG